MAQSATARSRGGGRRGGGAHRNRRVGERRVAGAAARGSGATNDSVACTRHAATMRRSMEFQPPRLRCYGELRGLAAAR